MRNAYEASGIIIDVLPVVMFHSGVCVCVCVCSLPNEIGNSSRARTDIFHALFHASRMIEIEGTK